MFQGVLMPLHDVCVPNCFLKCVCVGGNKPCYATLTLRLRLYLP